MMNRFVRPVDRPKRPPAPLRRRGMGVPGWQLLVERDSLAADSSPPTSAMGRSRRSPRHHCRRRVCRPFVPPSDHRHPTYGATNAQIDSSGLIEFDYRAHDTCNNLTFIYTFYNQQGIKVSEFQDQQSKQVTAG